MHHLENNKVVLVLQAEDINLTEHSGNPKIILEVKCVQEEVRLIKVDFQRQLAEWAGLMSSNSFGIEKVPKCICLGISNWDTTDENVKLLLKIF